MATILVTDDDTVCRRAVMKALEREGYTPEGASGVDEAMEAIAQKQFDLIICDYKMPGKSGLSLLRQLSRLNSRVPVLMMSAHADPETEEAAWELGAVALLKKPFRRRQLLESAVLAMQ